MGGHSTDWDLPQTEASTKLFERELLVARKAMSDKKYDVAIGHYTRALSTGRTDAACLGERGYARLLVKDPKAVDDLWYAVAAADADRLRAQIWYNLGLAFEQDGESEQSRAAFARSLVLGHSKQAADKLGARSHCTANIDRSEEPPAAAPVAVVSGWKGVHARFGLEGNPSSEAEARSLVCATTSGEFTSVVVGPKPNCADAPPWNLSCCAGFGGFMVQYMSVIPRSHGRFFTINYGARGGWPKTCQGKALPEQTQYGSVLLLKTDESSLTTNDDVGANADPAGDQACRAGPSETSYTVYQLDSGRRLIKVGVVAPLLATLTMNAAGTEALLSGGECNEKIALR
jgi:hypothetical protein